MVYPNTNILLILDKIEMKDRCIFVVPSEKCENIIRQRKLYCRDYQDLVRLANIVAICGQCAKKYNIKVLRTPTIGELNFTSTFVVPIVDKIVAKELARDN